jgi:hypothetical protein
VSVFIAHHYNSGPSRLASGSSPLSEQLIADADEAIRFGPSHRGQAELYFVFYEFDRLGSQRLGPSSGTVANSLIKFASIHVVPHRDQPPGSIKYSKTRPDPFGSDPEFESWGASTFPAAHIRTLERSSVNQPVLD